MFGLPVSCTFSLSNAKLDVKNRSSKLELWGKRMLGEVPTVKPNTLYIQVFSQTNTHLTFPNILVFFISNIQKISQKFQQTLQYIYLCQIEQSTILIS